MLDKNTVAQARRVDMIAFLEKRHGFTFVHRGGAYRCRQHESLAVKADRLSWYWHSRGLGGYGALDYLIKAENMTFREAVKVVTGIAPEAAQPQQIAKQPKTLILPDKAGIPLRLYDYLCRRRGIDGDVVTTLIQKGMLYEDKRGNIVFVGCDEHRQARFASLRGTYGDRRFRMDCAGSDKRYGFNMMADKQADRLYIFESPIDAMSHASLPSADTGVWERHSRLSLAGTSDAALPFFLNQHPCVRELVFALDNDPPGREASVTLAQKYAGQGYVTRIELPERKDWNEDLQSWIKEKRAQVRTVSVNKSL